MTDANSGQILLTDRDARIINCPYCHCWLFNIDEFCTHMMEEHLNNIWDSRWGLELD